jgi:hypothetical protein
VKITTHIIFGINVPHPKDKLNLTLNPPSTYARRHPLYIHPSKATSKPVRNTWQFHPYCRWSDEPDILAKNGIDSPTRTNASTIGGGGLEWGAWFEFTDKDDRITNPSLAFLADVFLNTPTLLPKSERVGLTTRYFCLSYSIINANSYGFLQLVSDYDFINRIQKQNPSLFFPTCRSYSRSVFVWSFHDCTSRKTRCLR